MRHNRAQNTKISPESVFRAAWAGRPSGRHYFLQASGAWVVLRVNLWSLPPPWTQLMQYGQPGLRYIPSSSSNQKVLDSVTLLGTGVRTYDVLML